MKYIKAAAFGFLAILSVWGAFKPSCLQYLTGVNILFHEAGHLFFMPLGQYWHVWGGTLTQLLIPFGIGVAFLRKYQPQSASVMFWWCGQNFLGIAAYIKDARAQVLPFVGGEEHDWTYLLYKHGLLQHDQKVGNAAWCAGLLIMLAASIWGMKLAWQEKPRGI